MIKGHWNVSQSIHSSFRTKKALAYITLMIGMKWKINWLLKSIKMIKPRSFPLQMIFLKYTACLVFMNVLTVKNQEDMEANRVKPSSVFIHICCSFIRSEERRVGKECKYRW